MKKFSEIKSSGLNFINILCESFSYKILPPKITKLCFGFEIFWRPNISAKRTQKMLMKLTPDDSNCRKRRTQTTSSLPAPNLQGHEEHHHPQGLRRLCP